MVHTFPDSSTQLGQPDFPCMHALRSEPLACRLVRKHENMWCQKASSETGRRGAPAGPARRPCAQQQPVATLARTRSHHESSDTSVRAVAKRRRLLGPAGAKNCPGLASTGGGGTGRERSPPPLAHARVHVGPRVRRAPITAHYRARRAACVYVLDSRACRN